MVFTESAFVLPTLFVLILGTVVGGFGIFRYQQISMLAREGARYASVHGGQYQQDTGNTAATATDVYNNAISPMATGLDMTQLNYSVSWNSNNMPYNVGNNYERPTGNTVTVTVTYNWFPEVYIVGPITLSSTSTMPMSY
jgi:Flp pilus assembly protein TadG